jgi:hypothetical protein
VSFSQVLFCLPNTERATKSVKWSRGKALELLTKWNSEGTELFLTCDSHPSRLQATGRIQNLSSDGFEFVSSDCFEFVWEGGSFMFKFSIADDVSFTFTQPVKSIMPLIHGETDVRYDCALSLIIKPRTRCTLYQTAFPALIND